MFNGFGGHQSVFNMRILIRVLCFVKGVGLIYENFYFFAFYHLRETVNRVRLLC